MPNQNQSPKPGQSPLLSERLLRGAAKLGSLWRSKIRCASRGWNILPGEFISDPFVIDSCECEKPNDFCKGRILWLTLAAENGQEIVAGDSGVALSMNPKQWDATLLTMSFPVSETEKVSLGPKGAMSMSHFHELSKDPKAAGSIFALLKAFPKARVEGIVEPSQDASLVR